MGAQQTGAQLIKAQHVAAKEDPSVRLFVTEGDFFVFIDVLLV
jgi:hypothetical protein